MKNLLIFGLFLVLSVASVRPAQAHILATNGNIGAILHIDPNDQPVAGQQTSFFFEFKDKTNSFDPANCDCTFVVLENGKQIYNQPLFQNSPTPTLSNAAVFYTLPKKDVYQVQVVGKPLQANTFQPFTLHWDIRVDQEASKQKTTSNNFLTTHWVHILMGIIGSALLLWFVLSQKKQQGEKKRGGEK